MGVGAAGQNRRPRSSFVVSSTSNHGGLQLECLPASCFPTNRAPLDKSRRLENLFYIEELDEFYPVVRDLSLLSLIYKSI
jgi:hypothetical protein